MWRVGPSATSASVRGNPAGLAEEQSRQVGSVSAASLSRPLAYESKAGSSSAAEVVGELLRLVAKQALQPDSIARRGLNQSVGEERQSWHDLDAPNPASGEPDFTRDEEALVDLHDRDVAAGEQYSR